ncbi:transposase [uncultured Roseibium sp.]|uniref:integrase core domain-containing protein n=1 Tax=uncultured Roseibium sp. TaxID=1936171 RepID=UPI0026297E10|nr:transposase [uncultured Roseibium sp.]
MWPRLCEKRSIYLQQCKSWCVPQERGRMLAFNGRFRAECLNAHWFLSLADAAEKLEDWRKDYNEHRPHGAIGNKVPVDLMKSEHAASPCS